MVGIQNFEMFLFASLILNMIPGSDTLYVLSRSVAQGRNVGIASVFGVSAGAFVHTLMAAIGLSAIITASATAFMVIKLVGAAYLVYLGLKLFFSQRVGITTATERSQSGFIQAFKQGMLTNVLNPKVAMFFLAFLPQFVSPNVESGLLSFLVLGLTFVVTSTLWGLGLATFAASISQTLRETPRYLNYVNKVSGGVLVALGLRLVTQ